MNQFNEIEKNILLSLLRRNKVGTNISILGDENLRKKYDKSEIIKAWLRLVDRGYLEGLSNGGGFGSAINYKRTKEHFKLNYCYYRLSSNLEKFWLFMWKNFLITIATSITIAYVTAKFIS